MHAGTRLLSILASLTMLQACSDGSSEPSPPEDPSLVLTTSGPLRGTVHDDFREFLGIPYAAPPVGDLRLRPPQPPSPWTTEHSATAFGPRCPQVASPFFPSSAPMDEDCLTLNVWTPHPGPAQLPVMVWIHGGGFMYDTAEASVYHGENLARAGVVVVTFDYRLGALGFLAHEALTAEDPEQPSSGNYALEDQQMVLRWVRDNIAAFGGDPGNVTLFGESAGSSSVCLHLTMPSSDGLFHRAILESGICGTEPTLADSESKGKQLADTVGCPGPDVPACLRSKSADELLNALPADPTMLLGEGVSWGPNVDARLLPQSPLNAVFSGQFADVPILLGANSDEGTVFVALADALSGARTEADYTTFVAGLAKKLGADASTIETEYPLSDYASPGAAMAAIIGDALFVCTSRTLARFVSMKNRPTYLYHFTEPFGLPQYPGLGAFHTGELPFVFRTPYMGGELTPEQVPLADAMVGYWTRFASTGDPNQAGTPAWPQYSSISDEHMQLARDLSTGSRLRAEKCDFWFGLFL